MGKVHSISISSKRGVLKDAIDSVNVNMQGIVGDGHSGDWGRQVTLLNYESYSNAQKNHPHLELRPGSFAENIIIEGIDFSQISVNTKIKINDVILEVSQIGKEDHPSVVTKTYGISLLPYEGLFCRILRTGQIKVGDSVSLLKSNETL